MYNKNILGLIIIMVLLFFSCKNSVPVRSVEKLAAFSGSDSVSINYDPKFINVELFDSDLKERELILLSPLIAVEADKLCDNIRSFKDVETIISLQYKYHNKKNIIYTFSLKEMKTINSSMKLLDSIFMTKNINNFLAKFENVPSEELKVFFENDRISSIDVYGFYGFNDYSHIYISFSLTSKEEFFYVFTVKYFPEWQVINIGKDTGKYPSATNENILK